MVVNDPLYVEEIILAFIKSREYVSKHELSQKFSYLRNKELKRILSKIPCIQDEHKTEAAYYVTNEAAAQAFIDNYSQKLWEKYLENCKPYPVSNKSPRNQFLQLTCNVKYVPQKLSISEQAFEYLKKIKKFRLITILDETRVVLSDINGLTKSDLSDATFVSPEDIAFALVADVKDILEKGKGHEAKKGKGK